MDPAIEPDQREDPQKVRTGPITEYQFAPPEANRTRTTVQPQTHNDEAGPSSAQGGQSPANNENAARKKAGIPKRNFIFPIFKCFRKLNNKLTMASHHYNFLMELRSNHKIPLGKL